MSDINAIKFELNAMANGTNADFASAAQYLLQVVAAVEQGQMSVSEAAEMMKDMQRQIAVIQNVEHLANKERLNTIINGLITLAGAV
jgi:polyhydroxyalkanoate synthesis regulator phasin